MLTQAEERHRHKHRWIGKCVACNRCQLLLGSNFVTVELSRPCKCLSQPAAFFSPCFHFYVLSPSLFGNTKQLSFYFSPPLFRFSQHFSVTMGLSIKGRESRGERGKNGKSESERGRVREWDKGADGMNAKNQQSHVRLIKINSFSLHSLRLSLFLYRRAQGVISKCFLRNA